MIDDTKKVKFSFYYTIDCLIKQYRRGRMDCLHLRKCMATQYKIPSQLTDTHLRGVRNKLEILSAVAEIS